MYKLSFNPFGGDCQASAWEVRQYQLGFAPNGEFLRRLHHVSPTWGLTTELADHNTIIIAIPTSETEHWERIEQELAKLEQKVKDALNVLALAECVKKEE